MGAGVGCGAAGGGAGDLHCRGQEAGLAELEAALSLGGGGVNWHSDGGPWRGVRGACGRWGCRARLQ
jgi:hypothetical protein